MDASERAIAAILDHVVEQHGAIDRLAVVHSDPPDLEEFVTRLAEVYPREPMLARFGSVVGTHFGPNAIGVTYLVS